VGSCSQNWNQQGMNRTGMSRDEYRAWKDERKAEWRARKAAWRENGWRPGYGWSPFNIAAMVIGFIIFFPIGLAILFWNVWTARRQRSEFAFANMNPMTGWNAAPWSQTNRDLSRNSGNAVFEDYKKATLERLEEERRKLAAEQDAFASFLDDLKRAKDRTEFERFMQERESARETSRDADPPPPVNEGPARQS
jgi:hypothetical protein